MVLQLCGVVGDVKAFRIFPLCKIYATYYNHNPLQNDKEKKRITQNQKHKSVNSFFLTTSSRGKPQWVWASRGDFWLYWVWVVMYCKMASYVLNSEYWRMSWIVHFSWSQGGTGSSKAESLGRAVELFCDMREWWWFWNLAITTWDVWNPCRWWDNLKLPI